MRYYSLNIITFLYTAFFWIIIFSLTPQSLIEKHRYKLEIIGSEKEIDSNNSLEDNLGLSMQNIKKDPKLRKFGNAVGIYSIVLLFGIVIISEKKLVNYKYFLFSLGNLILALILASIYYNMTKESAFLIDRYKFLFTILNVAPTMLISYFIIGFLWIKIFGDQPEIVSLMGAFRDQENWFFTIISLGIGVILGILIDLIDKVDRILMYFT